MGIFESLMAMLPSILPPLIAAVSKIIAAWATGKIDTETAIREMHAAIAESGEKMAEFEASLKAQHANFDAEMARLKAAGK